MSWPLVALKDCCDVVGGATPKRNVAEYWDNDIPWVTPKDVSNLKHPVLQDAPEYISKLGYEKCATYLLPENSILLTSRAPIGNLAIAGRAMCTNQGFKSLVPSAEVDSKYLYHCMKLYSPKLQALGNGATFKEVSKKVVENFEIPLPPLAEQKRIAAILDKADAIRRKREKAIELTDTLLKSVFLDMFGDPVTNPKGWERKPLSTFISKLTSGSRGWAKFYSDEGGKFLRIQNVGFSALKLQDMAYVQAPENAEAKRTLVAPGDLLLSITADLGRTGVIPDGFGEGYINQHLAKLTFKNICPYFVSHYISSKGGLSLLSASDKGGVKAGLNFNDINEYQIFDPPEELQRQFSATRTKIQCLFAKNNRTFDTYESLLASLTQRAFRGELTANDLDKIEAA
ncbi:MAG: restriction endonuclease subunit S [Hyphomicrobiales bacterium]